MANSSNQFQREFRLLTANDYSRVFDQAIKVYNKAFTLLARSNQFEHPRLGLVIAKKNLTFAWIRQLFSPRFGFDKLSLFSSSF